MKSKLSVDKQGNLKLYALNNDAKLTLAKNGFLFKIEFLQLLPTKKPQWVQALPEEEKENRGATQGRTLKLCFEYVRVKQTFSIV